MYDNLCGGLSCCRVRKWGHLLRAEGEPRHGAMRKALLCRIAGKSEQGLAGGDIVEVNLRGTFKRGGIPRAQVSD